MAHHVELMRGRVGDRHRPGEIGGRRGDVAVKVVHHQRPAKTPLIQRLLHLDIGLIIATHEAQLHEPRPDGLLGLHHGQAFGGRLRQRLFTQHPLARANAGQRQRRMSEIGAGDDDGIDVGTGDHGLGVAGDILCAKVIRHAPRPGAVHVADHLQARAGQILGHDPGVVRPHQSCAYHCYPHCHLQSACSVSSLGPASGYLQRSGSTRVTPDPSLVQWRVEGRHGSRGQTAGTPNPGAAIKLAAARGHCGFPYSFRSRLPTSSSSLPAMKSVISSRVRSPLRKSAAIVPRISTRAPK